MSRRQKGPTVEEQIQKLDTRFSEYQTANDENVEKQKEETKENIERLDNDFKDNIHNVNNEIKSLQTELQKQHDLFEEKHLDHNKTFNETQETLTNFGLKMEELENGIKNLDEKFGSTLENIEQKLENNKEGMSSNLNENNEKLCDTMENIKQELKIEMVEILKSFKDEKDSNEIKINEITTNLANLNSIMENKMEENFNLLLSRMENDAKNSESIKDGQDVEMNALKDEVSAMIARVDDISEKMYEFEQNKKNNLLFYGIGSDNRETPDSLVQKIFIIMKTTLGLRREIPIVKASRVLTGPEIVGSRPVVVTFETFRDKEEVLRKSSLLRGSNIHVTEDMNRKTRESRSELRRFMRNIKRTNPSLNCVLQYDKLVVDNKIFIWNDIQGKVIEQSEGSGSVNGSNSPCPCSRPASVMTDSGFNSSLSLRSPPKSPKKSIIRAQSMFNNYDDGEMEESLKERDDRIRELEEIIARQDQMMKEMKNQMKPTTELLENEDNIDDQMMKEMKNQMEPTTEIIENEDNIELDAESVES